MEHLDTTLATLRTRLTNLEAFRANLATTLLSSTQTLTRLEKHQQRHRPREKHTRALKLLEKQSKRNVENIHRTCAGITAYKVQDPDPHAVDGGNVLGIRIEVFVNGTFLPPYHLLLVRSHTQYPSHLKLSHHTIPPFIPLSPLLMKYLPQPTLDSIDPPAQNLHRLARCIRRELVSYHLRLAAVSKMREEAGLPLSTELEKGGEALKPALGELLNGELGSKEQEEEEEDEDDEEDDRRRRRERRLEKGKGGIIAIEADKPVREITVKWVDDSTARLRVSKDGLVEKAVVRARDGARVSRVEKRAVGRVEGLVGRLVQKST